MKKILSFGILSLVTMLAALVASPVFAGNHGQAAGDVIRGRYIARPCAPTMSKTCPLYPELV